MDLHLIQRLARPADTKIVLLVNERLCERLHEIELDGAEVFVETIKEHRLLLVLRGDGLTGDVSDTDPQQTGVPPKEPQARSDEAAKTARLVADFLKQAREKLEHEDAADMVILLGFDRQPNWPQFPDVFGLHAAAIADSPMYRGVARLVGMDVLEADAGIDAHVDTPTEHWDDNDFFYVHEKQIDSAGEDGDFERRTALIHEVDAQVPSILELGPDVLVVTGDHSTPARLKYHSWHPVPVLLYADSARPDTVDHFGEAACTRGGLGAARPAADLMPLAMAHGMRLEKFGA